MAEWNVQYTKYSTIHNTMYHIIMSADVWNGIIFSVRMLLGVVYWNIPQSQAGSSSGIQIHQDIGHQIHTRFTLYSHMSKSWTQLSKLEELQDRTQSRTGHPGTIICENLGPDSAVGRITGQKKTYSIYMYYCCFKSCKYWLRSDIS